MRPHLICAWVQKILILFADLMSIAFNAQGSVVKVHVWKLQMPSKYVFELFSS